MYVCISAQRSMHNGNEKLRSLPLGDGGGLQPRDWQDRGRWVVCVCVLCVGGFRQGGFVLFEGRHSVCVWPGGISERGACTHTHTPSTAKPLMMPGKKTILLRLPFRNCNIHTRPSLLSSNATKYTKQARRKRSTSVPSTNTSTQSTSRRARSCGRRRRTGKCYVRVYV